MVAVAGSIVDSGALVEVSTADEDAASATLTPERTNARVEVEYMLMLEELKSVN